MKYSQDFTALQLVQDVQEFMDKMCEPEQFQGRIIFMSVFNDIASGSEDADLVSIYARRFPPGRWSFFKPGSRKRSGILLMIAKHKENVKFGESGHPVFRATSPLSRGTLKSRGGGQLSIHFCADGETIETIFRTIIFVNQLSICGAVSDLCDEYKSLPCKNGETCIGRTI